jgi:hypothetical protein
MRRKNGMATFITYNIHTAVTNLNSGRHPKKFEAFLATGWMRMLLWLMREVMVPLEHLGRND